MLGDLDIRGMEALLRSETVGRIGCHAEGRTYIVPVTYVYEDGYLYSHAGFGMKVRMMRANPHVCFEVDRMQDMANWQSVIAWGTYEELQGEEAAQAMQRLIERLRPLVTSVTSHPPEHAVAASRFHAGLSNGHPVMYRIRLTEMTGRFETNSISPVEEAAERNHGYPEEWQ